MSELEEIKAKICAIAPEIEEHFGVKILGVFGSVARGEAKPDSDVDVLFDTTRRIGLMNVVKTQSFIEDALDRPVDLVDDVALRTNVRVLIQADLSRL
jgi:hypothetical protein